MCIAQKGKNMNIIKHGLKFKGTLSYRSKTDEIVWHHSGGGGTVESIHNMHIRDKKWVGIGYNLVIYKDGTVHEGRPLNAIGAHATGHNSRGIGVCCIGNFENETMPAAQLRAAKEVQAYLKGKYPKAATKKHRDVNATTCPGKNFPFTEISGTAGSTSVTTPTPAKPQQATGDIAELQAECNRQGFSAQTVDNIAGPNTLAGCPMLKMGARGNITKWLQKRLNKLGFNCGTADGIFGSMTKAAVIAFQRAMGLVADGIVGVKTWSKLLGLS